MSYRSADGDAGLDAQITSFGEALAAYDFVPEPEHDEALLADYASALDAYEQAKRALRSAGSVDAARLAVRRVLDDGLRALERLDARRQGRPIRPEPVCFFDARHGSAVAEVSWVPPGGAARVIAVCAADAVRLREGDTPILAGRLPQGRRAHGSDGSRGSGASRTGGRVVRIQGPGPSVFSVEREPEVAAVLVLRAVSYGRRLSTVLRQARRGSGASRSGEVLLRMSGDFTARLPLPAADTPERSAGFSLSNSAVAGAPFDPQDFDVDRIPYWEAWTESVHSCRQFSTTIDGEGWDVVRYAGGRATGRLRRDTRRGEAVIVRLNEQFGFVDQLVRAHGSTFSGEVVMPAKPCWLAVRCPDGWSLTVSR